MHKETFAGVTGSRTGPTGPFQVTGGKTLCEQKRVAVIKKTPSFGTEPSGEKSSTFLSPEEPALMAFREKKQQGRPISTGRAALPGAGADEANPPSGANLVFSCF